MNHREAQHADYAAADVGGWDEARRLAAELTKLRAELDALRKLAKAVWIWRQWYPRGKGVHADNLAARYDEYAAEHAEGARL